MHESLSNVNKNKSGNKIDIVLLSFSIWSDLPSIRWQSGFHRTIKRAFRRQPQKQIEIIDECERKKRTALVLDAHRMDDCAPATVKIVKWRTSAGR